MGVISWKVVYNRVEKEELVFSIRTTAFGFGKPANKFDAPKHNDLKSSPIIRTTVLNGVMDLSTLKQATRGVIATKRKQSTAKSSN